MKCVITKYQCGAEFKSPEGRLLTCLLLRPHVGMCAGVPSEETISHGRMRSEMRVAK